jgi:hypothetical protein
MEASCHLDSSLQIEKSSLKNSRDLTNVLFILSVPRIRHCLQNHLCLLKKWLLPNHCVPGSLICRGDSPITSYDKTALGRSISPSLENRGGDRGGILERWQLSGVSKDEEESVRQRARGKCSRQRKWAGSLENRALLRIVSNYWEFSVCAKCHCWLWGYQDVESRDPALKEFTVKATRNVKW